MPLRLTHHQDKGHYLLNERDAYHHQASELADVFENQPLVITDAVLLEIGNALSRSFKSEAVQVIDHFLNSSEVEVVRLRAYLDRQRINSPQSNQTCLRRFMQSPRRRTSFSCGEFIRCKKTY